MVLVGIGRRLVQLIRDDPAEDEPDPDDPVADALQRAPGAWDVESIRVLLESGDSNARRRALGWVIATPHLSEQEASDVTTVFIEFFLQEQGLERRVSIRALREIHRHYPSVVEKEITALATGLNAYHAGVRRETGRLLATLIEQQPALAGTVYPYLVEDGREHRQSALECLLLAAQSQPVVLFPIQPAIKREIERGFVSKYIIAECVGILAKNDPTFDPGLVQHLLAWYPADTARLEASIVDALTSRTDWSSDLRRQVIPIVLRGLATATVRDEHQTSHWLTGLPFDTPGVAEECEAWAAEHPVTARRRVAVTVHEATGTIPRKLLELLLLDNDPILAGVA